MSHHILCGGFLIQRHIILEMQLLPVLRLLTWTVPYPLQSGFTIRRETLLILLLQMTVVLSSLQIKYVLRFPYLRFPVLAISAPPTRHLSTSIVYGTQRKGLFPPFRCRCRIAVRSVVLKFRYYKKISFRSSRTTKICRCRLSLDIGWSSNGNGNGTDIRKRHGRRATK